MDDLVLTTNKISPPPNPPTHHICVIRWTGEPCHPRGGTDKYCIHTEKGAKFTSPRSVIQSSRVEEWKVICILPLLMDAMGGVDLYYGISRSPIRDDCFTRWIGRSPPTRGWQITSFIILKYKEESLALQVQWEYLVRERSHKFEITNTGVQTNLLTNLNSKHSPNYTSISKTTR